MRSRQRYLGAEWKHEFGDGWSINHNVKFSRNWADWNSSSGVTPRSLEWPNFFSTMGIQFTGGGQANRVPAGLYRFADRRTGAVLAEVTSNGSFTVNANALNNPGLIVRFANLPNNQILPHALWTNNGRVANEHMDEIMERLAITKRYRNMAFTAGGNFGYAGISDRQSSGGRTASPLTEQPQPLAITWIPATAATAPAGTPAAALAAVAPWNGRPVSLTNPEGFTALGVGYTRDEGIARQFAYFFGHKWDLTSRWGIDWGFRGENYIVKGSNQTGSQNPRGNWDATYGGADGDPYHGRQPFSGAKPEREMEFRQECPELFVVGREQLRHQQRELILRPLRRWREGARLRLLPDLHLAVSAQQPEGPSADRRAMGTWIPLAARPVRAHRDAVLEPPRQHQQQPAGDRSGRHHALLP